jgi:hypothetical protein
MRVFVRVEVRGRDAGGHDALQLRAQLRVDVQSAARIAARSRPTVAGSG